MKVTLLDQQGVKLTEITTHLAGSGQLIVDSATRPDALFHHYFDRGSRVVTAVTGAVKWTATLGTRWQMGARFWFLHGFLPLRAPAQDVEQARFDADAEPRTGDAPNPRAGQAVANLTARDAAPERARRGVPA